MNRQDMMYRPEIYDRPMFQTPQTRQGSGIMAGVAPVRGFEDGGYAGYMPDTGGYEGYLEDITADDVSDFFTTDKGSLIGENEQGPTLTARDITDLFIVDPEDPIDVALATATAGLLAAGITAPAAMVAQLARMGYKGSKVIDKVSKAVEVGKSGTLKGLESTRQAVRLGSEVPEIVKQFTSDEVMVAEEPSQNSGGIASLIQPETMVDSEVEVDTPSIDYDRVRALSQMNAANGGIVSLNKGGVLSKIAQNIVDIAKSTDAPFGPNTARIMLDDGVKKGEILVDEVPSILKAIKGANKKPKNQKTKKEKPKVVEAVEETVEEVGPRGSFLGIDEGIAAGGRALGRGALGAGRLALGNKTLSLGLGVPALTYGGVKIFGGDDQPPVPPPAPPVESAIAEAEAEVKSQGSLDKDVVEPKEKGFFGNMMDRLTDPRVQAGLANAGRATEGWAPRNFFSDFNEGSMNYDLQRSKIDLQQAQIENLNKEEKTTLMANYEFLKKQLEGTEGISEQDILDMALSLNKSSGSNTLVNTLFKDLREQYGETRTQADLMKEARATAAGETYEPDTSGFKVEDP
jgi:hypothetical protein